MNYPAINPVSTLYKNWAIQAQPNGENRVQIVDPTGETIYSLPPETSIYYCQRLIDRAIDRGILDDLLASHLPADLYFSATDLLIRLLN